MEEHKSVKPGTVTPEDCEKGIQLLALKLTGGEIINGDEFTDWMHEMKKKYGM